MSEVNAVKTCGVCPHHCQLKEGQTGYCTARSNQSLNYGEITSLALDPIEKKPLRNFMPGSFILSVGSWGCNMKCPWCQNDSISRGRCRHI
ncbi:MAG: radical SAM protein, partial [Lachnospiraceae bacterium]|nr:radical SAM protein [Lachnospiraceae bacterium]